MDNLDKYNAELSKAFFDISEDIKADADLATQLQNPDQDIDQVLEKNLKVLLDENQLYSNFQILTKNKIQLEKFQKHAEELTKMLKDKTAKKREKAQARQRELKNRSNIHLAFGKKEDALAAAFAHKLKGAALERKSQNERDSCENFVIE